MASYASMGLGDGLTKADYEVLAAHYAAVRRFGRFSEYAARRVNLAPQMHELLLAIKGSPGKDYATVAELVQTLQCSYRVALNWLSRAEADGLLRRELPCGPRKPANFYLTKSGEAYVAALQSLHRHQLAELRRERTAVPAEVARTGLACIKALVRFATAGTVRVWYRRIAKYALAVAIAVLGVAAGEGLRAVTTRNAYVLSLLVAVMASAAIGGIGPALVTSLACALAMAYFFLPPHQSLMVDAISDVERLAAFTILAALFAWMLPLARQRTVRAPASSFGFGLQLSWLFSGYALAVVVVPVGVLAAAALDRMFPGPDFPWILLGVVAVSAWYGGLGPGLLATALCLFATVYFFLPPLYDLRVHSQSQLIQVVEFGLLAAVVTSMAVLRGLRPRRTTHSPVGLA